MFLSIDDDDVIGAVLAVPAPSDVPIQGDVLVQTILTC